MARPLTARARAGGVGGVRDWGDSRVVVTGATGFIGSHLVRRLESLGAQVHAVSRRPPDDGRLWHTADLGDADVTGELVRTTRPDVVFHLASAVTGIRDVNLVLPTLQSNLSSTVNLLTAVTGTDTRVVLAGSIEEPREADPVPPSPYAAAKWAATGYARMFHGLWDVQVVVLRVAMVYGPNQPDTDKLLPYVTLSLLREQQPRVSSGRRLVDWVYVDDVVDAFVLAAQADDVAGRVVDIGSGTQISIRDTVEMVARRIGSPARPLFGAVPDRPLDRPAVAATEAAAELLGWRASTSLEEGVRRTVAWYAARL